MKKIVLDTNFLMLPAQMFDIFTHLEALMQEPYVLVIVEPTLLELKKLAQGKSKDARAAQLGLSLLNAKIAENPTLWEKLVGLAPKDKQLRKVQVIKSEGYADDVIIKLADKNTFVATLDKKLAQRLKKENIPVIGVKNKRLTLSP